ncbi:fatty acyl-AMP ligase [Mycobacterium sp. M1]|uniref:Fatty acyl-AMP ligase n=1 Tax=Mycolicibacter acidiphilus TaxID=2835306 RepID=A0ABS5RKW4_9MYCO|nr:fatty acyl-AMP ligase [Mycolicibacter acidiphilus]MBS9534141.1 fatty acyl-AMP ligase [Mycolicibacter acidiphilus]
MDIAAPTTTLVDLLRRQADRYGDRVAFSFAYNGDDDGRSELSYRELDRRARAIAANLQRHGAAGERVLVMVRPGLDFIAGFFGCLYAGAIAVPVHQKLAPRLQVVVPDAQARFALTATETREATRAAVAGIPGAPEQWFLTDAGADPDTWTAPGIDADSPALIQYTSGSTRLPKGVVLTHRNLLHNVDTIHQAWNGDDTSIGVYWLPPHHDMGLIGGILEMLHLGCTTYLMSPTAFVKEPMRWLRLISGRRGVITAAPNFAYQMCVDASTAQERAALDLSGLTTAMNGAEPVRASTLAAFADAFAPAGFRLGSFFPVYGLAEASLLVSGGSDSGMPGVRYVDRGALGSDRVVDIAADAPAATPLVGCGRPRGDQDVIIVDPVTFECCDVDEVGEIWVSGPSVAVGYWGRPEETEQTFAGRTADGAGPYLRTGDLGFLCAGELFITGRVKDLVVIDGHHYYPNDIEATVAACHPALAAGRGAVFAVPPMPGAVEQLIVVQEVDREQASDSVVDAIRSAVRARHGIEAGAVVLVEPRSLPVTSSGKIQRGQAAQRFADGTLAVLARWQAPAPALADLQAAADTLAQLQAAAALQGDPRPGG